MLSACANTNAPESCTVSGAQIEAVQAQFAATASAKAMNINAAQPADLQRPEIDGPFDPYIEVITNADGADKAAPFGYGWVVPIAKGCTLTASVGTTDVKTTNAFSQTVKALRFNSQKRAGQSVQFDPIEIVLDK